MCGVASFFFLFFRGDGSFERVGGGGNLFRLLREEELMELKENSGESLRSTR